MHRKILPISFLIFPLVLCSEELADSHSKENDQPPAVDLALAKKYKINYMVDELEYGLYVKYVFNLLKNHDDVIDKLIDDFEKGGFKDGKVGKHLDLIPVKYRSGLDELKRFELERIKELGESLQKRVGSEAAIRRTMKSLSAHLDLQDPTKFGDDDLRKLIRQASKDIEKLDTRRKYYFKEYEMHKRLELDELKKRLSPEELAHVEENIEELERKHKRKKPMHMPVSKAHLLKVWEERDHLSKDNFNIKTFFHLHDLDGNGFLDEDEVKILIETEIKETYDPEDVDFDPKERHEEMEEMREYVFENADVGEKDHLLSMKEFIDHVQSKGMDDNHFWEILDKDSQFTTEEYERYAKENRAEVNKMIDEGLITLPTTGVVMHRE